MNIEQIKANWSKTDEIIYRTPEVKLASIIESKTKVIAKQ